MLTDIKTVKDLRKSIREAKMVLVQPRFGLSEAYVKISKREAVAMMDGLTDDMTPDSLGMATDSFASVNEIGELYIG